MQQKQQSSSSSSSSGGGGSEASCGDVGKKETNKYSNPAAGWLPDFLPVLFFISEHTVHIPWSGWHIQTYLHADVK